MTEKETEEEKVARLKRMRAWFEEEMGHLRRVEAINKNIMLLHNGLELVLKLTDYRKGYWAEAPLSEEEANTLSDRLFLFGFIRPELRKIEKELYDLEEKMRRR